MYNPNQQYPQQQGQAPAQGQIQQPKKGIDIVLQGRMVWGSVKQQTKKIFGTNQDQLDAKGQPIPIWTFGLAIPKVHQGSSQHEIQNFQTFWNAVHQAAATLGVQPGNKNFAWKFYDGDGTKEDGVTPYPEHSRGCYVLVCSTRIPLKLMKWEDGQCKQAMEDEMKAGYYYQVALNIEPHGAPNAGLYINPSFVARFAFGPEIINVPDATVVFGNTPPPMVPGASATPIGGMPFAGPAGFNGQPTGFNPQQPAPGFNPQAGQQQPQAYNPGAPNMANQGGQQQPGYNPNFGVIPPQLQPNGGAAPAGAQVPQQQAGGQTNYVPQPGYNNQAPQPGSAPMAAQGHGGYQQQAPGPQMANQFGQQPQGYNPGYNGQ